jgi:drug/metabolite transporter (DMT)-like permease
LQELKNNFQVLRWLIVALLAITWGSSFILMKKSLVGLSAVEVASLRICITAVALLPFTILHFKKIPKSKIKFIALSGLLGSGIPAFLFATAQSHISSSVAGVLNSLTPVWALTLGILFFKLKTSWLQIVGIITGFLGAISLLIFGNHHQSFQTEFGYAMLIVIATCMYGANLNLLKLKLADISPFEIAALAFFFISIPVLIYLFCFSDFVFRLQTNPKALPSLGFVSVLAIVGTATASVVFYWLVQKTSTLFGAITTYFIPIVAVIWGAIDGESIGLMHLLGLCFILLGVWMVAKRKSS